MERALIYHTETGVICGRFASKDDAQRWLDGYEDEKHECRACNKTWWIEGPDS